MEGLIKEEDFVEFKKEDNEAKYEFTLVLHIWHGDASTSHTSFSSHTEIFDVLVKRPPPH